MLGRCALAVAPGAALFSQSLGRNHGANDFDKCWLGFRDRFGVVWGQRLREQFNQAARHAGWRVVLTWQGLRISAPGQLPSSDQRVATMETLQVLMKRFGKATVA
jgi:hypothetical protein